MFGQETIYLFPTLDGNHISSDEEEEQEQQDSDPYIGVAFRLHLLEQGES